MSDAPHWPGAEGSPGLQFSRSKPEDGEPADATRAIPRMNDATPPVDQARPATAADDAGFDRLRVPPKPPSAEDWELDSITRRSDTKPGPSYETKPGADVPPVRSAVAAAKRPDPTPTPAPARGARRTRKARLRLHRIDPWSVMKTSFLFSIAFGIMLVAGVAVLWSVFAGSDTMTYINDFVNSIMAGGTEGPTFDIHNYLGWERVVGLTTVLAAIDVVIFTAVATLFAFLYNLSAIIMGGLELTLAED